MALKPLVFAQLSVEVDFPHPLATARHAFAPKNQFLLDGAGAPPDRPDLARFALFGAEPFLTFRATRSSARRRGGGLGARVVVTGAGGSDSIVADVDDPLGIVRAILAENALPLDEATELPLVGGAVGYVGYETGQILERLPCIARPSIGMPDIAFGFHRWVLGRSRSGSESGRTWLSVIGRGLTRDDARRDAEATRDDVVQRLARVVPVPERAFASGALACSMTRDEYVDRVRTAKRHIEEGDAFEICLTHGLEAHFEGDPWDLFATLRASNPAPFAAILDLPEGAIVSSSPERFVRLDRARVAESRPIKGTRPRGDDRQRDAELATELARSEKDRAENAMIVDLVRNDLGKVCTWGTVTVPVSFAVEPYATVHQLVSTVRGELEPGRDAIDLLGACFPPGSMTGAPKIEAVSLLEALEPRERGVYSGALGFIGFDGTMDTSVVIRTIVVKDGRAHVSVGGAVVADSDPAAEHDETLQKAEALARALGSGP